MVVKIVAENWVKADRMDSFMPLINELVAKSSAEDGCLEYRLFVDREDDTHLVLVEEWENMEKLEVHRETEHFQRILPLLAPYMAKPGTILRMKPAQ